MENLSERATAMVAIGFVLFVLALGYGWQKVEEVRNPVVRCEMHLQHMTCGSVRKAA